MIRQFFTFRKPQPDYFQGPTGAGQWGWLEVYPQHAFYKTPGVPEQVAVGVGQNAADGKLSVFTNPRAHGRSFRNDTGRNEIVAAKVSIDGNAVSFYVRSRDKLTNANQPNWMLLFIDSDNNPRTGWLGYDLVVNRRDAGERTTVVERNIGGRYAWGSPLDVVVRIAGNELELAISRDLLGIGTLPRSIDFKWADNIQQTGDWSDFTLNGDAGPNDRYNFRALFRTAVP
jgi:hypothetical protein